jgi:hypothetical protein
VEKTAQLGAKVEIRYRINQNLGKSCGKDTTFAKTTLGVFPLA